MIIINESHCQTTALDFQSACDLQRESEAQHRLLSGVSRQEINNLLLFSYCSWSSSSCFVYLYGCAQDDLLLNVEKPPIHKILQPFILNDASGRDIV